jgi:hypothetical protein
MKLLRNEILYRESYIVIQYNDADNWIYVNWRGYVHYETVTAGCEKILELMKELNCYRILNDNTNVEGIWSGASTWVGQNWFPRMIESGLECFAWVYSPSTLSRLSTDKSIRNTDDKSYIKTFDHIIEAEDWLRIS